MISVGKPWNVATLFNDHSRLPNGLRMVGCEVQQSEAENDGGA
jgi:hypothetical protein